ncbi:MAG: BatD family protein [Phycisphaerae bacterium]|nr:BatD family protein [Phycisphaerae bacterium]
MPSRTSRRHLFNPNAMIMIQTRIQIICIALLIPLALGLAGCDKSGPSSEHKAFAIDQEVPRGPLTVHVRVDSNSVSIAQTLTVELEAAIQPGYTVKMPSVDRLLEQFGIVDRDAFGEKLDQDMRTVKTVRYELEPFLTGTYDIPAFQFEFSDVNDPNKTYTLDTEPIPVEITSLLGEDRDNLVISDIEDVVTLPTQIKWLWIWVSVACWLVVVGLIVLMVYLKKRHIPKIVRLFKPAHEIAYERLRRLVLENLIDSGQIKTFYERISTILRHYIEDRFHLKAPERTTEEFLQELKHSPVLPDSDKQDLAEFLNHCDLVKFAKHEPTKEQIQKTFDLVKGFIEKTKSMEAQVDVTDAAQPISAGGDA